MRKTDHDARNAHKVPRSLADAHVLRLTALLFELVEARSRRGAAEVVGVSCGALVRAADTGHLTGPMRDVGGEVRPVLFGGFASAGRVAHATRHRSQGRVVAVQPCVHGYGRVRRGDAGILGWRYDPGSTRNCRHRPSRCQNSTKRRTPLRRKYRMQ